MTQHQTKDDAAFLKFDEDLGLIFGYAIVSKIDGEDHFDLQGDHIPEDSMLKAAADFMEKSRVAGEMHARDEDGNPESIGKVLFAFPLTSEIAAALDITMKRSGLIIAMKPTSEAAIEKARNGDYRGFSIGGRRIEDEDA